MVSAAGNCRVCGENGLLIFAVPEQFGTEVPFVICNSFASVEDHGEMDPEPTGFPDAEYERLVPRPDPDPTKKVPTWLLFVIGGGLLAVVALLLFL